MIYGICLDMKILPIYEKIGKSMNNLSYSYLQLESISL